MKGYLVMVRYGMDDVPIALFEKKRSAKAMSCLSKTALHKYAVSAAEKLGYSDFSNPISVIIVRFENGVPVKSSLVRVF